VKGSPLARKGCGGDDVDEGVAASWLVWWQGMWWYGMLEDGGECGGVVVRGYMSGEKGNSMMIGCRLCEDGGCVVGGDDGCLLNGGESVWRRVVLTFFFTSWHSEDLGSSGNCLPFAF